MSAMGLISGDRFGQLRVRPEQLGLPGDRYDRPMKRTLACLRSSVIATSIILLPGCGSDESDAPPGARSGALECTPQAFTGEPVSAPDNVWTTVPVPEAVCRDGTPASLQFRIKPGSDKLVIYMQGGGACFSNSSCLIN